MSAIRSQQRAARLARCGGGLHHRHRRLIGKAALDQLLSTPLASLSLEAARIRRQATALPRRPWMVAWARMRWASTGGELDVAQPGRLASRSRARNVVDRRLHVVAGPAPKAGRATRSMRGDVWLPAVDGGRSRSPIAAAAKATSGTDRGEQSRGVEMPLETHFMPTLGNSRYDGLKPATPQKARRPDHRAAGLCAGRNREEARGDALPPSPMTSHPACVPRFLGLRGLAWVEDGRTRW